MSSEVGYRDLILRRLRVRNALESRSGLAELVRVQTILRAQLEEANAHNEVLRNNNKGENTRPNRIVEEELRSKLFSLQEELTDMHRRKGDNAQQVLDLSAKCSRKEEEMIALKNKIGTMEQQVEKLNNELKHIRLESIELGKTNQLLKDEYQTLQLTLTSTESRLVDVQKENAMLINQVMMLKERDVSKLNAENDSFRRRQEDKLKEQLADATKERQQHRSVNISDSKLVKLAPLTNGPPMDSSVCVLSRLPRRAYLTFDAHEGEVNAVHWSPNNALLATAGGSDRKIKLWDVSKSNSAELTGTLSGSNGGFASIDFDVSGTLLLAASLDFAARIWNLSDFRLKHTLTGHSAKVLAARFVGSDGHKAVTGSHDRTLKVWDLRSRVCIRTLFPGSSCNDLASGQLDTLIVSGHFDKKLRFYDIRVAGNAQPTNETLLGGKVTSVEMDSNGRQLLACTRDDVLNLIDLRNTNQPLRVFRASGFHVGCDWTRATFSPDAAYVAVGSGDGAIYVWDTEANINAKPEICVRGEHESCVVAVAWQPSGASFASCDKAKRVVVWTDF